MHKKAKTKNIFAKSKKQTANRVTKYGRIDMKRERMSNMKRNGEKDQIHLEMNRTSVYNVHTDFT